MARTALALLLVASPASAAVSVHDGDTITIDGTRYRISGIDAPELKQPCHRQDGTAWPCGLAARAAMVDLVGDGAGLACRPGALDRYRRIVATCYRAGVDIGQEMVRRGLAMAYRRFSRVYVPDEAGARVRGVGIWQGSFAAPWDWRKAR